MTAKELRYFFLFFFKGKVIINRCSICVLPGVFLYWNLVSPSSSSGSFGFVKVYFSIPTSQRAEHLGFRKLDGFNKGKCSKNFNIGSYLAEFDSGWKIIKFWQALYCPCGWTDWALLRLTGTGVCWQFISHNQRWESSFGKDSIVPFYRLCLITMGLTCTDDNQM